MDKFFLQKFYYITGFWDKKFNFCKFANFFADSKSRAFQWCIICHIWTSNMWFRDRVNFMWSFMKRWLCPIYNGFPENFIWSIIWKIASIFHGLEVFQSDLTSLCFSAVEICQSLLLKDYNHWWYLIHTWSDKAFRGTFVNQESMSEGHEMSL